MINQYIHQFPWMIIEKLKIVDYLCKQGHKNIAIITAPMNDVSIGKLRFEGYKKALEDNNISLIAILLDL